MDNQIYPQTNFNQPSQLKSKKFIIIIIAISVLLIAGGVLVYFLFLKPEETKTGNSERGMAVEEQTGKVLSGWKKYRYESYGFEFQLPEEWQQIESDFPPTNDTETLTYELKGAEYYSNAHAYIFRIMIIKNPNQFSYEKLFGMEDRRDLVEDYYAEEANITIDSVPAKLIYNNPDFNDGPIAIIPLEKRYIMIISPKEEMVSLGNTEGFKQFLSTFNFFEPIPGASNTSKPVQKEQTQNIYEWCEKAPVPGKCFADLARTEEKPESSLCEKITLQNSGPKGEASEGFYYFYKNSCYQYVAQKLNNISLCDKMEGSGQFEGNKTTAIRDCKSWVNYNLAIQNSDVSFCNKMDIDTYIGYGGSVTSTVNYLNCYVAVAVKLNNQHICDNIISRKSSSGGVSTKEWCYYTFAVVQKDCSLVPPNSPAPKSQCESQIKY